MAKSDEVKSWILRKLGHPTISVELSEDQLDDCLSDAIEEVAPWVVQRTFITVPTQQRIDLSKYSVDYVIQVIKTKSNRSYSGDVFSYTNIVYGTSTNMLYNELERVLVDKTMNTLVDQLSFRYIDPYLYLDTGYPYSDSVTIEYSPKITKIDDIVSNLYITYVKNFALAHANLLLSTVRGKYRISNSPYELDADTRRELATSELDRLREEIKKTVPANFMLD